MTVSSHEGKGFLQLPAVDDILEKKDRDRFNALPLEQQLRLVLDSYGQTRIELLKLSDRFEELVQALPPEEILLTVEEAEGEDLLAIVKATSMEQFTFLTDIRWWQQDEIDPQRVSGWLQLLVECGEEKILDWLFNVDPELLVTVLKRSLSVIKCTEDFTPPEEAADEGIFTLDGLYYFKCFDQTLLPTWRKILMLYRSYDPEAFVSTMEAVIWENLIEVEQLAYHFRQSRLAERGFPDLDEALEIYTYIPRERQKDVLRGGPAVVRGDESLTPAPRYPLKSQDHAVLLARALKQIGDQRIFEQFCYGLVAVANKVQVADGLELGHPESIRISARKTAGYINIALEELSGMNLTTATDLVQRVHPQHLFQIGYSRVQDLKLRAHKLVRIGWISKVPDGIELLDSPWRQILGGLLKSRPGYYIGDKTLALQDYREFRTRAEIETVTKGLDMIEYQGHLLFEHLGLTTELLEQLRRKWVRIHPLRLSTVFLTAMAKYLLGQTFSPEPLSTQDVRELLLLIRRRKEDGSLAPGLNPDVKERLLADLAELGCAHDEREALLLKEFLNYCWNLMEDEIGNVNVDVPIEPQYISVLVVQ